MEITRVVRLTFGVEHTATFEQIFRDSKQAIRSFPGCLHLEMMRDHDHSNVYYTYSKWTSIDALNAYRSSEFFEETWAKTKVLFCDRPSAFSLYSAESVNI